MQEKQMEWNSFCDAVGDMDRAYMKSLWESLGESLGADIGTRQDDEVFDMWPMLFGYSL